MTISYSILVCEMCPQRSMCRSLFPGMLQVLLLAQTPRCHLYNQSRMPLRVLELRYIQGALRAAGLDVNLGATSGRDKNLVFFKNFYFRRITFRQKQFRVGFGVEMSQGPTLKAQVKFQAHTKEAKGWARSSQSLKSLALLKFRPTMGSLILKS